MCAAKNLLEEAMRWFGPADSVTLAEIRQTGATAVFSSLHEVPYGEAWPAELVAERRDEISRAGLEWRVVESVPVHEAIKTRTGDFERRIENYKVTLERIGAAGIGMVVYNFMPAVVQALLEEQRARVPAGRTDWRLPLRPDHGHMMLDDLERPAPACPGYPIIGRMRGLAELRGLQLGVASLLPNKLHGASFVSASVALAASCNVRQVSERLDCHSDFRRLLCCESRCTRKPFE